MGAIFGIFEALKSVTTSARRRRLVVRSRGVCGLRQPGDEVDSVRLRYRSKPLPCTVAEEGRGRLTLHLGEPCDGAAPGQTACLYAGDVVVGYGTIA